MAEKRDQKLTNMRSSVVSLPGEINLESLIYYSTRNLPNNLSMEKFLATVVTTLPSCSYGDVGINSFFGGIFPGSGAYVIRIKEKYFELYSESNSAGEKISEILKNIAEKSASTGEIKK